VCVCVWGGIVISGVSGGFFLRITFGCVFPSYCASFHPFVYTTPVFGWFFWIPLDVPPHTTYYLLSTHPIPYSVRTPSLTESVCTCE
jgi:hypothetical protein